MKSYDVLYIGNYTKDTIISPSGTRYVDGGAVNYAAHAAAQLGLKVAVVTRLSKDDDRGGKFIRSGIDCYPIYTPQSTLEVEYPTTDPDIRSLSVTATAARSLQAKWKTSTLPRRHWFQFRARSE
jgi:hypothetical protein